VAVRVHPGLTEDQRVDIDVFPFGEGGADPEGGKEAVHIRLVRNLDRRTDMGKHKPVVAHHDRNEGMLGDGISLDDCIQDLLAVAAIKLDPSGVSLGDGVLLVVEDSPWRADPAVHTCHHNRDPAP
jgi:hypothetical protein